MMSISAVAVLLVYLTLKDTRRLMKHTAVTTRLQLRSATKARKQAERASREQIAASVKPLLQIDFSGPFYRDYQNVKRDLLSDKPADILFQTFCRVKNVTPNVAQIVSFEVMLKDHDDSWAKSGSWILLEGDELWRSNADIGPSKSAVAPIAEKEDDFAIGLGFRDDLNSFEDWIELERNPPSVHVVLHYKDTHGNFYELSQLFRCINSRDGTFVPEYVEPYNQDKIVLGSA